MPEPQKRRKEDFVPETRIGKTMSFVESAKGILTLVGTVIAMGLAFAGWVSQHLVFAGDLQKQSQQFQVQQIESNERLARYQKQELENRIFLLDSKATRTPQDQALRNRYEQQMQEVNRDLRELQAQKDQIRRK
jgi:uncharacterized protein HemX